MELSARQALAIGARSKKLEGEEFHDYYETALAGRD
jgi:hypothetical protein